MPNTSIPLIKIATMLAAALTAPFLLRAKRHVIPKSTSITTTAIPRNLPGRSLLLTSMNSRTAVMIA